MNLQPTDAELCELYRNWWQDSYGNVPNAQATSIAAAFARHVLTTYKEKGDGSTS
jgi:hypothetical protein